MLIGKWFQELYQIMFSPSVWQTIHWFFSVMHARMQVRSRRSPPSPSGYKLGCQRRDRPTRTEQWRQTGRAPDCLQACRVAAGCWPRVDSIEDHFTWLHVMSLRCGATLQGQLLHWQSPDSYAPDRRHYTVYREL